MAKKKGARDHIALECEICGNRNYRTSKMLRGTPKLNIQKYCPHCQGHKLHKEKKK